MSFRVDQLPMISLWAKNEATESDNLFVVEFCVGIVKECIAETKASGEYDHLVMQKLLADLRAATTRLKELNGDLFLGEAARLQRDRAMQAYINSFMHLRSMLDQVQGDAQEDTDE
jgi:hypothetical protein